MSEKWVAFTLYAQCTVYLDHGNVWVYHTFSFDFVNIAIILTVGSSDNELTINSLVFVTSHICMSPD